MSRGQLQLLWDRELLDDARIATLSPEEQQGVRFIGVARAEAAALGLRPSTSYRHLVDRDERTSVRVVVAAPKDRVAPLTWWFPLVGRVAYRGYFDWDRAERFAEGLREEGYDTYVRTSTFYSTLGYFDDPIPRLALRWSETDLVDVIIHELVHGTVFVSNDTAYNESLASFIAQEATLRYLAERPDDLARARRLYADRDRYAQLVDALARDLEEAYAASADTSDAIARRAGIFERYQSEVYPSMGFETQRYAGFQTLDLSNAFVVAQRSYSGLLPCMRAELEALGGDLEAFIDAHRAKPGRRLEPAELCASTP